MPVNCILHIDDDPDDLELFQTALERTGGNVNCISLYDPREALAKLNACEIVPDVIFLDLNMPIMSGGTFLEAIKQEEKLSNIPVFILSTTSHHGSIQKYTALGATGFFTKPDRLKELTGILKSVLEL